MQQIITYLTLIPSRQLIERTRELTKKCKELEELKNSNETYLASIERKYGEETALYRKRSGGYSIAFCRVVFVRTVYFHVRYYLMKVVSHSVLLLHLMCDMYDEVVVMFVRTLLSNCIISVPLSS